MEKTVQACAQCGVILDDFFPQTSCTLSRCPRVAVERIIAIKEERAPVERPRTSGWKLNADEVRLIRKLAAGGHSSRELARSFGVSPATVREVVRRITWRDLPDVPEEVAA
jgi:DNA-binding CsgD family transcriptional regulator